MADHDVRERCAEAALEAKLPAHFQWGQEAMGHFVYGLQRAAEAIRALDLPLTSAREVTEDARERAYNAGVLFMVQNPEYAAHSAASMKRLTDLVVEAALASAPQPACVGVGEDVVRQAREFMRANDWNPNNRACELMTALCDALSPAPSPQAGCDEEHAYRVAVRDAAGIIEAKLPHYGEGYERLLMDIRDEIIALEPRTTLSARREG